MIAKEADVVHFRFGAVAVEREWPARSRGACPWRSRAGRRGGLEQRSFWRPWSAKVEVAFPFRRE